jgi:hypothetical protein
MREICDHARRAVGEARLDARRSCEGQTLLLVTAIRRKSYQGPPLAAHMDTGRMTPCLIKLGEVTL